MAHFLSYSAPHAQKWKSVIPTCTAHTLSAPHYIVSARLNLRLRPYHTALPPDCASCGTKDAIALDSWHHLSCNSHKRQQLNLRHDSVVHALYHHSDHSGAAACKEPQGLSTEDGRRPDLQIVLPGASILTDVVVSHPLAPSHVSVASTTVLAVAQQAAKRKQASTRTSPPLNTPTSFLSPWRPQEASARRQPNSSTRSASHARTTFHYPRRWSAAGV